MRSTLTRGLTVCALALGLTAFGPAGAARAANLDKALLMQKGKGKNGGTEMEALLAYLSKQKYKNVGVLPFVVKKGKAKEPTFVAAPLATGFPARLEAAMIMTMDPASKNLIGIITDAAGAASSQKVGAWAQSKAAFAKLFAVNYELPYGNNKVKADAFLTGQITCIDGMKTKVVIVAFDKNGMKDNKLAMKRVATFEVENDRALLRDLGFGYALPRTALARGSSASSRDKAAREIVSRSLRGASRSDDPASSPDGFAGMKFELFYNGQKQELKPLTGEGNGRQFAAPPAPAGAKITMTLARTLDDAAKTLGAVIKVNGKSTWNMEEKESIDCFRWVYKPDSKGRVDTFKGFSMGDEGEKTREFATMTARESDTKVSELGERAGWIDVDVFESGAGNDDGDKQEMQITLRGLSRGQGAKAAKPRNFTELQANLRKINNVKLGKSAASRSLEGGLIVAGLEEQPSPKVGSSSFPNPRRVGGISIRYYEKARGGSDGITITQD